MWANKKCHINVKVVRDNYLVTAEMVIPRTSIVTLINCERSNGEDVEYYLKPNSCN